MFDTRVLTVLMDAPDDVSRLRRLIDDGQVAVSDIQGINVSHEGDGFSRVLTSQAFAALLAEESGTSPEEILETIPIQAIAGMSGFMVPHAAVIVRQEVSRPASGDKRLIGAGGCTRKLQPEEVGTITHVHLVRDTVARLIEEAHIDDPSDVHFVFVKGPWPVGAQRREAEERGNRLVADSDPMVGQLSRGACALGAALALGEVTEEQIGKAGILGDLEKMYSSTTHCSSGSERQSNAIILLGNSSSSCSDSVIGHGVLKDGLDTTGVKGILRTMGFEFECCPAERDLERIEYAFVKPKSGELPTIRGHRHTLHTDMVLGPFAWNVEKAPVHGAIASVLGTPLMEVATGPEHQGPPGCPLVAVVARAA